MLYHILTSYINEFTFLNIFKYITFRALLAIITALTFSFIFGEKIIARLKLIQFKGQPIREDGPSTHLSKIGTPTMGGIMILMSTTLSTLLWTDLTNPFIWVCITIFIGYGIIGLTDDYLKVRNYNSYKGVRGRTKLFWQGLISIIATFIISYYTPQAIAYKITIPFVKNLSIDLGVLYYLFAAIVITGASNAVNLTDGLDGLASGTVTIAAACFALICYIVGNSIFSEYLQIPSITGVGEVAIFCAAIMGGTLGFLWYNALPAQIFMGDVGSLALGGALGAVSVLAKHEIVLAIIGGLFVIEALSVIIQVFCFKILKYRPFKMAPIHHHFEKLGWSESKVVIRFWIIALIFALLGLASLKLR